MRARRQNNSGADYLTDALALLAGWSREGRELKRVLRLDDAQHAALTERVQVVADALQLRPSIRRIQGYTQIMVGTPTGTLTAGQVAMAARIEDVYRSITAD